jgi:ketosteroid isomerase-like protein
VAAGNAALVRRLYAGFVERGEPDRRAYTDDFVWDMSTFRGWPERPQYRGFEGVLEFLDDWIGSFDDWSLEVREVIEAGEEVVVICHQSGRSRSTGAEVDMIFAQVWTVRGDKLSYQRMYADVDEALASVDTERPKGSRPNL